MVPLIESSSGTGEITSVEIAQQRRTRQRTNPGIEWEIYEAVVLRLGDIHADEPVDRSRCDVGPETRTYITLVTMHTVGRDRERRC